MGESLLAVVGLNRSYFWGTRSALEVWTLPDPLLLLGYLVISGLGLLALQKRPLPAALVTLGLAGGTVGDAALASLVYPTYAERTILPAVLGWCLLLGAAADYGVRWWPRALSLLGVTIVLGLSLITTRAVYHADKQHWHQLAKATDAVHANGAPIVTIPTITQTLITLYAPDALDGQHLAIDDGGALPESVVDEASGMPQLWLSYIETPTSAHVRAQLVAHGYELREHREFRDTLVLDHYARPEVAFDDAQFLGPNLLGPR
jgi:hypothetical protein